jgi:hypothetical protein
LYFFTLSCTICTNFNLFIFSFLISRRGQTHNSIKLQWFCLSLQWYCVYSDNFPEIFWMCLLEIRWTLCENKSKLPTKKGSIFQIRRNSITSDTSRVLYNNSSDLFINKYVVLNIQCSYYCCMHFLGTENNTNSHNVYWRFWQVI